MSEVPPPGDENHTIPPTEGMEHFGKALGDISQANHVVLPILTGEAATAQRQKDYAKNVSKILEMDKEDLPYLRRRGGQLRTPGTHSSDEERADALSLIRQTWKQAHDEARLQEEKRPTFEKLDTHLRQHFPDVLPDIGHIKEEYRSNYETILRLEAGAKMRARHGILETGGPPPTQEETAEAMRLIEQTYRQAWGGLIDADHGMALREQKLHELDTLRAHLAVHFPSVLAKDPQKPLKILTRIYSTTKRDRAYTQEVEKRVAALADGVLFRQKPVEKGINPTAVIAMGQKRVAVAKAESERAMGKLTALMRGEKAEQGPQYAQIGGFNELLAAQASHLLQGLFTIPLAQREGAETLHAFAKSRGSFGSLFEDDPADKWDLLSMMPLRAMQGFLLGQIALNGMDCHVHNILIDNDYRPIAIDFGLCLGFDPLDENCLPRGCYFDWNRGLEEPLEPEILEIFDKLDVDAVCSHLEAGLHAQMADLFSNSPLAEVAQRHLLHFRARLTALKIGIEAGLTTVLQLQALFVPPISAQESRELHQKCTDAGIDHEAIDPEAQSPKADIDDLAVMVNEVMNRHGFRRAWVRGLESGDWEAAEAILREECQTILRTDDLYGTRERYWYERIGLDITDYGYPASLPELA